MRGLLFVVWLSAALALMGAMAEYENRPGISNSAIARRPSSIPSPAPGQKQLIMLLHPKCPCSRASLEELTQLLSRYRENLSTLILVFAPSDAPERWSRASSIVTAEAIPGVTLRMDPGGFDARQLGATTSGHVFIFDPEGQRLFSGGITGGRAMVGDNPGYAAALDAIRTGKPSSANTIPVFGCPIITDQEPD